jgi:hypothetical protein
MAQATATPHSSRNGLLPRLALVDRSLVELRVPERKLRNVGAVHVREVANTIAALGYCEPGLVDQDMA